MRVRVVIVGGVLLVLLAGIFAVHAIGLASHPKAARGPASPDPASVTAVAATQGDVVTRVLATGTVTSIRDAKLGSRISGRVATVLVDEGARVQAGTPLLRLDINDLLAQQAQAQASVAAARAQLQKVLVGARPQERQQSADAVDQARANLNSAQANLQWAQLTVGRNRSLKAQGAISQQDLDQSETQVRVAQAQLAQARAAYDSAVQNASLVRIGSRQEDIQAARAQLAQAEAALAAIQVQIHDSTIYAPFAGTITQRNVEPGEIVSSVSASSTNPLLVLSQVSDVYVEFIVPAQHRFELHPGQPAEMAVDGLPGQTFQGRVEEIRPAAEVASRTFGVRVRIPNPSGVLRPGMFARGAVVVRVRHNVLQIPEQAVVTATSGPMVFVVRDGLALRRAVALGTHHDGMVEVTSGLTAGEQVVSQGQEALTDNERVVLRSR
jgi:RND family efflux transporter MFP subunit